MARVDDELEQKPLRKIKWANLGRCAVYAGAAIERGADADALARRTCTPLFVRNKRNSLLNHFTFFFFFFALNLL